MSRKARRASELKSGRGGMSAYVLLLLLIKRVLRPSRGLQLRFQLLDSVLKDITVMLKFLDLQAVRLRSLFSSAILLRVVTSNAEPRSDRLTPASPANDRSLTLLVSATKTLSFSVSSHCAA